MNTTTTKDFIQYIQDNLPPDPLEAAIFVATSVPSRLLRTSTTEEINLEALLHAYAFFITHCAHHHIEFEPVDFDLSNTALTVNRIKQFFHTHEHSLNAALELHRRQTILKDAKELYQQRLISSITYTFSESDLTEIRTLLNALSLEINALTVFKADHKQRLLRRLHELIRELKTEMTHVDHFWGFASEVKIAVTAAGQEGQPILSTTYRIIKFIFSAQQIAHGLPADALVPLLSFYDARQSTYLA